ncbi:MAG: hypothetical protein AAGG59_18440, partial [Bacteroidota bacterium]
DWPANPIVTYLYYYGYLAQGLDGIVSWIGKNLFHISYVIVLSVIWRDNNVRNMKQIFPYPGHNTIQSLC